MNLDEIFRRMRDHPLDNENNPKRFRKHVEITDDEVLLRVAEVVLAQEDVNMKLEVVRSAALRHQAALAELGIILRKVYPSIFHDDCDHVRHVRFKGKDYVVGYKCEDY